MIFDGHGDILTDVSEQLDLGIDIWNDYHKPRYQEAGVNGSIFVNFTDPNSEEQKSQFTNISNKAINYFKDDQSVNIILNRDNFTEDKFNLILGIEGLGAIESVEQIDYLYDLGYRHIGITWNEQNRFASGIGFEGGITSEGQKLIVKCNELGIVLDFAHLNNQSFEEAAELTQKPIFFSHGNAKAVCNHPRNLDDAQLQKIADTNGVIGLAAMRFFLNDDKEAATINDLVKHVLYIKDNFGIDYVGFGFDFCYYLGSHQGKNKVTSLEHIDDVPKIIDLLKDAGLSDDEIEKVCYKNIIRVIKEHLK